MTHVTISRSCFRSSTLAALLAIGLVHVMGAVSLTAGEATPPSVPAAPASATAPPPPPTAVQPAGPTTPPPSPHSSHPVPASWQAPGYLWVPGRWEWTGSEYTWRAGSWQASQVPPQATLAWVDGHWITDASGNWSWIPAHFEELTPGPPPVVAAQSLPPSVVQPATGSNTVIVEQAPEVDYSSSVVIGAPIYYGYGFGYPYYGGYYGGYHGGYHGYYGGGYYHHPVVGFPLPLPIPFFGHHGR